MMFCQNLTFFGSLRNRALLKVHLDSLGVLQLMFTLTTWFGSRFISIVWVFSNSCSHSQQGFAQGLLLIPNPFTGPGQRYWVCRCLRDYTHKPQRLNLDAHGDLKNGEEWWELCNKSLENKQRLLKKLRWATLGYHHNWDSKMYSQEAHDTFPADLATLCQFVARVAGFEDFSAEAAIVNFYHMDSTLSGLY
uniref:Alpha-ketoglutarate-dependent dioxygenase AlkB-like domain-containing protein n=1 Tax=Timema douglasi TaxID=61478 RepID=A0A7R8VNT7_TIMDO|nr:unnamed protein product [Timema douglasi]